MANFKKNGNLSGAVGNVVFVNDGNRVFVRSRPAKVKQSARTKASARVFGLVSAREKLLRLKLLEILDLPALQYFAARHRARIRKTVGMDSSISGEDAIQFGNPQALAGFSFNPNREWQDCTNFFPEFELEANHQIKVNISALNWKKQIMPPKNSSSAVLTLVALTVDMNNASVPVNVQSTMEFEINNNSSVPTQEWIFSVDSAEGWLVIVGCLKFNSPNPAARAQEYFSAGYLWAGLPGN